MAHWIIQFKTIKGDTCTVKIGGAAEDTTIQASANPLTINTDDDDDFFKALRSSSAILNVYASASVINDILSGTNPTSRPVEIYTSTDSSLWRGFVECGSYNQEWNDAMPHEYSINMISPLRILDGINFDTTQHGFITIGELLKSIVGRFTLASGEKMINYLVFDNTRTPIATTLKRYVNCDNWIEILDEQNIDGSWYTGKKLSDVMSDICYVHGWQLHEVGDTWFMTNNDEKHVTNNYRISVDDLDASDIESKINIYSARSITVTSTDFTSCDNKEAVVRAKRSITITGSDTSLDEQLWGLDFDKLLHGGYAKYEDNEGLIPEYEGNMSILDTLLKPNNEDVFYLHQDAAYQSVIMKRWRQYKDGGSAKSACKYGGASCNRFTWVNVLGKTKMEEFTDYLVIAAKYNASSTEPTTTPIVKIRPQQYISTSEYASYICIKGSVYEESSFGIEESNHQTRTTKAIIKFGSKYYNSYNKSWSDSLAYSLITFFKDGSIIISSNAYENENMPRGYDGKGSLIQLPFNSEGFLEIQIMEPQTSNGNPDTDAWSAIGNGTSNGCVAILIKNLAVYLYNEDIVGQRICDDDNIVSKFISNGNEDDYDISFNLTCGHDSQKGKGCVYVFGEMSATENKMKKYGTDTPLTRLGYIRATSLDSSNKTPEQSLCDRAYSVMSVSRITHTANIKSKGLKNPASNVIFFGETHHILGQSLNVRDASLKLKTIKL